MATPQEKAQHKQYWAVEPSKAANGSPAGELWLYGTITEEKYDESDVTPHDLVNSLNALGKIDELNVHVFSGGGSVFAGNAIYHLLKQREEAVNIYVEGLAASIASVIAMAGDRTYIARNAMLYVHGVMGFMLGLYNKTDLQKMITELDRISDVTIRAYEDKTGLSPDEIYALLNANDGEGTWFNAEQAVQMGFADAITPEAKAPTDMVAMVKPNVYMCRGHEIDLSIYKNIPDLAGVVNKLKNGGNQVPTNKPKAATRGKFRAELVGIMCPHCDKALELDTASGIVTLNPSEGATVGVPTDETVEMRNERKYRNEAWKITCPSCGGEFGYDTAPDGAVSTDGSDASFTPDAPLPQARRNPQARKRSTPFKATQSRVYRMQTETVPITCTECGTEFEMDLDPTIEEALVQCPSCGAELTVDTSNVGGSDTGGDSGLPEPATNEPDVVAFRKGIVNERKRITILNERKAAFPQHAKAIDGFIQNGTSIQCVNNWLFKAMAAKERQGDGNGGFKAAARRDAAVLNSLGHPMAANDKQAVIDAQFDALAQRRGTKKNA